MMETTATTWTFSTPTEELARHALADIGKDGKPIEGSVSSPMSGSLPVRITSLEYLELFVKPLAEKQMTSSFRCSYHYVHPQDIPTWIREQLGDEELASCIEEINGQDLAYVKAAPLIKSALAQRIAQHREVLGLDPVPDRSSTGTQNVGSCSVDA